MKFDKKTKMVLYGLLMWLIPFVASFFFFDPATQKLTIDETFFKSIMIVLSSSIGVLFLIDYFKEIKTGFVKEGLIAGIVWLVINWGLDLFILLPMMKNDIGTYFMQVGLRYLIIPIMSVGMGKIIQNSKE